MEVKLLEGGTVKLKFRDKRIRSEGKSKSKFQYEIGQQLVKKYPYDIIFEEIIVPGDRFILDFFIPSLKLVIECNGRQHREHIKHFHKTRREFHYQQDVDQKKKRLV